MSLFEHFTTPEEIFSFKRGSALTMEHDTLEMLGDLEEQVQRPELKRLFREHADETRGAAEVAKLLQQNLQQEEGAREKVKQAATQISQTGIAYRP